MIAIFFLKSATRSSIITWSKSSPPSLLSPAVDSASNTPSPDSQQMMHEMYRHLSQKQELFASLSVLSKPYANAAAVGSLMIRSTSKPAILPASLVA